MNNNYLLFRFEFHVVSPLRFIIRQLPRTLNAPVRGANSSPIRGPRQSPTPRQRIQLEKTNPKSRFSAVEDVETMEYGETPSSPPSPTPKSVGQILHRLQNLNALKMNNH